MKQLLFALPIALGIGCHPMVIHGDHGFDSGQRSTVNSSISVTPGTKEAQSYSSVNGSIRIGDGSASEGASTVNGSIRVGADCTVGGTLSTVNGRIACGSGTRVRGTVETVNGSIQLERAVVGKQVRTVNGHIDLEGATVEGDVVVKGKHSGWSWGIRKTLVIELTHGAVVKGSIRVEDDSRPVEVRVSADSKIEGSVHGATVVKL